MITINKNKNISIEKVVYSIILTGVIIYFLSITRNLMIPFVISLILFFIFNNSTKFLTHMFKKYLKFKEFPAKFIAAGLTVGISAFFIFMIFSLVTSNINALQEEAPKYQKRLYNKISALQEWTKSFAGDSLESPNPKVKKSRSAEKHNTTDNPNRNRQITLTDPFPKDLSFNIEKSLKEMVRNIQIPDLGEKLIKTLNFSTFFKTIGSIFTMLAKNTSLIIIYLIFLFLEKQQFRNKIKKARRINQSLNDFIPTMKIINKQFLTYLKVKSAASASTGILSFIVLSVLGIDFASFWAIIIFLFNFIPTIGSIIAVLFPITLSIMQFDSFVMIFLTGVLLTAIQIMIGNFIEPKFLSKTLNLSALTILISLGIWGKIWGILGMFLSVPIMVALNIVLANIKETRIIAVLLSANGNVILNDKSKKEEDEENPENEPEL